MVWASAPRWVAGSCWWLLPLLATLSLASLVCLWSSLRALAWVGFILFLSAAGVSLAGSVASGAPDAIRLLARSCAMTSLVFSIGGAACRQGRAGNRAVVPPSVTDRAYLAALVVGSVAFTVQLIILGIRTVYVLVDLIQAVPVEGAWDYGFGPEGLWTLGFLCASCAVALIATMERQLYTCQFLIIVMIATWASALLPVFHMTSPGGLRGAGMVLALALSLAVTLILAAWAQRWEARPGLRATPSNGEQVSVADQPWPGFRLSFTVVGVVVLLLACYRLAVPVDFSSHGFRVVALSLAASTALASWAGFTFLSRSFNRGLADVSFGLTSLTACGIAVAVLPSYPTPLAERYPVIFNALLVGLAASMGLCTWLATRTAAKPAQNSPGTLEDRLALRARRGAFLSGVLAVAVGCIMALWPQLPTIAVLDVTIGRVTAGFGGNLFLLLVALWSARRMRAGPFNVLTLLAAASAAGFMLMRMLSYSPRFG
ncbi:MAG: hypothetical protein JSU63_20590 [Phycisphaerales bacterium]|nr:MAG: hypothetical protein JSU63_20590 [Phycisphaerales bacterium]